MVGGQCGRDEEPGGQQETKRYRRLTTHGPQGAKGLPGSVDIGGRVQVESEACEHLWDRDSGRMMFADTMSLKRFQAYSSALRFEDRGTRDLLEHSATHGSARCTRTDQRTCFRNMEEPETVLVL